MGKVTLINVGYGDAVLFRTDDGKLVMLDGGSALESEYAGDAYRVRSAEYLKAQHITHLDALIISHVHEDHVCGLEAVLKDVSVDSIYVPYPVAPFLKGKDLQAGEGAARSVPLYTNALNAYRHIMVNAAEKGIPVKEMVLGDTFAPVCGIEMQILAPKRENIATYMALVEEAYAEGTTQARITEILTTLDSTSNGTSFLLRTEMNGSVLLLAADSVPKEWTESYTPRLNDVKVFKLPHHGQRDAVDEAFMKDMPLTHVITTSASDRRYNSANPEVYERLTAMQPDCPPMFLFSDEREYPPYFSQPEGFNAIELTIEAGKVTPAYIRL